MNEGLQRIEPQAIQAAEPGEPQDLLALAVRQGASVDTLERLMVVRKELQAEQAKKAFDAAMSAFQAEVPIIVRSRAGHENRYNYAPLEKIVGMVTPIMAKHGFSHKEDGVVTEGWVEAIVVVTHRDGHSTTTRFKVPAESKAGMSPQQKYGAAMTYATRYAFCAAFGIRTADSDTDCSPEADESTTSLLSKLWEILKPVRGEANNWKQAKQWLVDECLIDPDCILKELEPAALRAVTGKVVAKLGGAR